jgi:hypothetical protein
MRTTLATLAMAVLWAVPAFGQTDKTFYFTQPASPADITAMTTMIREPSVEVRDLSCA